MAQRESTGGKSHSRSTLYAFNEYKDRFGITDDLAPAEKLEKLQDLFVRLASCTRAISDNLQPDELQRRLDDTNVPVTREGMQMLLKENVHALGLLRRCVAEMGANPKSYKRGTTSSFAECVRIYAEEEERLEAGKKELGNLLTAPDTWATANGSRKGGGIRPAMTCLLVQITPLVLAVEEMIAA